MVSAPEHSAEAEAAITAELVRLTLGARGPRRPELNVLFAQQFAAISRAFSSAASAVGLAMLPAFGSIIRAASDMEAQMRRVQKAINPEGPTCP